MGKELDMSGEQVNSLTQEKISFGLLIFNKKQSP